MIKLIKLINPYVALIVVLAVGLAYISGKSEGYQAGFNKAKNDSLEAQKAAVARAIKQANQINQQNQIIAQEYWQAKLNAKPKIKTIEKRIVKYVQTIKPGHCDLDDHELRIINDLVDTANGSTADNKAKN